MFGRPYLRQKNDGNVDILTSAQSEKGLTRSFSSCASAGCYLEKVFPREPNTMQQCPCSLSSCSKLLSRPLLISHSSSTVSSIKTRNGDRYDSPLLVFVIRKTLNQSSFAVSRSHAIAWRLHCMVRVCGRFWSWTAIGVANRRFT
jgi:hypothetical protein